MPLPRAPLPIGFDAVPTYAVGVRDGSGGWHLHAVAVTRPAAMAVAGAAVRRLGVDRVRLVEHFPAPRFEADTTGATGAISSTVR